MMQVTTVFCGSRMVLLALEEFPSFLFHYYMQLIASIACHGGCGVSRGRELFGMFIMLLALRSEKFSGRKYGRKYGGWW